MHYLALGDSISIDDYTGVRGGGAASQLARRLRADPFQDLTRDGNVVEGVLRDLERVDGRPDVVTITAGGNNLLVGHGPEHILPLLERVAERVKSYGATVILSNVYDPTDGDDSLAAATGFPLELRVRHRAVNDGICELAARYGFLLADLEKLFSAHGVRAAEPWFVMTIEPNLAGATAIAVHWHALLGSARQKE